MKHEAPFNVELVKLVDGSRLLRIVDAATGTCLERTVNPNASVTRQKQLLSNALRSLLHGELKEVA